MRLKRILGVLLSVVMCFSLFSFNVAADEAKSSEAMDEYAFNTMSLYVSLDTKSNYGNITISKPMSLNNYDGGANNKTVYFALRNEKPVGMMTVDIANGSFVSSFTQIDYPEITSAYENETPISLNIINECLVMYDGRKTSLLIDSKGEGISWNQRSANAPLEVIENTNKPLEIVNYNARSVILNRQLDVSRVKNDSVNGIGICWAAVTAQNINYLKGTNYTARNIYDTCADNYTGTPSGNSTRYKRAYNLYNIDVTISEAATNYTQIYGLLNSGRPIGMSLSRSGGAHSVSLSGITAIDTPSLQAVYYIVDPNVSSYPIAVDVSYAVMQNGSNFTYATSYGYTYTKWTRTVYKT